MLDKTGIIFTHRPKIFSEENQNIDVLIFGT